MASISEQKEFESWLHAFRAGALTPEQLQVLQEMVDEGKAATLEQAAQMLDWHETVIDPEEHMYGF